jgi:uncharacterized protein (UPF0333 family)
MVAAAILVAGIAAFFVGDASNNGDTTVTIDAVGISADATGADQTVEQPQGDSVPVELGPARVHERGSDEHDR